MPRRPRPGPRGPRRRRRGAPARGAAPRSATLEVASDLTSGAAPARHRGAPARQRAFARVFGRPPLVVRAGGTLPILAALADRGIPTVMAGLALPTCTHSPNERMLLETFPLGVEAARETYLALGGLSPSGGTA